MSRTSVSIVIPSYNSERYLGESIESALAAVARLPQGAGEVVLVDDASSDGSHAIACSFEPHLRVARNARNLGQERTTNRALRLAQGQYAAILHSDDVMHPNFCTELAALLDRHPSAVLAVGERLEIGPTGEVLHPPVPFYDRACLIPGPEQSKVFLVSGFLPCQVMFRRRAILSFGGAQRHLVVNLDGLLWFKASLLGDVAYVQTPVGSYRRHDGSATAALNTSLEHLFEYYCTLKAMFAFAERRGVSLAGERSKAFRRIAELAVRWAGDIHRRGDDALASRYLQMAAAIDPTIRERPEAADLEAAMHVQEPVLAGTAARRVSYPPPPGSQPLESRS